VRGARPIPPRDGVSVAAGPGPNSEASSAPVEPRRRWAVVSGRAGQSRRWAVGSAPVWPVRWESAWRRSVAGRVGSTGGAAAGAPGSVGCGIQRWAHPHPPAGRRIPMSGSPARRCRAPASHRSRATAPRVDGSHRRRPGLSLSVQARVDPSRETWAPGRVCQRSVESAAPWPTPAPCSPRAWSPAGTLLRRMPVP